MRHGTILALIAVLLTPLGVFSCPDQGFQRTVRCDTTMIGVVGFWRALPNTEDPENRLIVIVDNRPFATFTCVPDPVWPNLYECYDLP